MSEHTQIFGVLVTYRRQGMLAATLQRILTQTRVPDHLVVVDNEASNETRRIVGSCAAKHEHQRTTYLSTPSNVGPAGGDALGMSHSLAHAGDDDWLLVLDDDDPPLAATDLERVFEFAQWQKQRSNRLAAVGIVGARFNWWTGQLMRVPNEELHGPVLVDYLGSNHLPLYSAKVMREVGVFQKDLFWREEVEYGIRLRRSGYELVAHGDFWMERRIKAGRVNHRVRPSRICNVNWRKYYAIRNHIALMCRYKRYDLAVQAVLIQCFAKPLYTALRSPSRAYRGLCLALRATVDGFNQRMGRTVDPMEFVRRAGCG